MVVGHYFFVICYSLMVLHTQHQHLCNKELGRNGPNRYISCLSLYKLPRHFPNPLYIFFTYLYNALWFRSAKNRDVSTGPLARPFARLLAPLTRSLAPDCSLRSHPPLRSLIRSLARGKVYNLMSQLHIVLNHSGSVIPKHRFACVSLILRGWRSGA